MLDRELKLIKGFIIVLGSITILSCSLLFYKMQNTETRVVVIEREVVPVVNVSRHFNGDYSSMSLEEAILYLNPHFDPALAQRYSAVIEKYARKYGFPPKFIACIIWRESAFNPVAISSVNAVGLMQVYPKWHKDKMEARNIDYYQLFHIENNVDVGCQILREYFDREKDIRRALLRYVGGDHPTYVEDILRAYANISIPLPPSDQFVADAEEKKEKKRS